MADNEYRKGSVYQDWNEDVRKRYIQVLDLIIRNLKEIPYYPFCITEIDVLKLTESARAMGIEVDEKKLYNKQRFFEIRGEVIKAAVKKVEEYLKPTNPLEDAVKAADEEFPDLKVDEDGTEELS